MNYSLNSYQVHQLAIYILSQLPLQARGGKVQVTDLLNVLLFAAACRTSIHESCQQLEGAPSGATVLGELARKLDDLDELDQCLNRLLATLLPKRLGAKGRRVAIDLVRIPYHGRVPSQHQQEVCRSKATQGTTHLPRLTCSSGAAAIPWLSAGCAREKRCSRCSRLWCVGSRPWGSR